MRTFLCEICNRYRHRARWRGSRGSLQESLWATATQAVRIIFGRANLYLRPGPNQLFRSTLLAPLRTGRSTMNPHQPQARKSTSTRHAHAIHPANFPSVAKHPDDLRRELLQGKEENLSRWAIHEAVGPAPAFAPGPVFALPRLHEFCRLAENCPLCNHVVSSACKSRCIVNNHGTLRDRARDLDVQTCCQAYLQSIVARPSP
jgi:hypothetical protein